MRGAVVGLVVVAGIALLGCRQTRGKAQPVATQTQAQPPEQPVTEEPEPEEPTLDDTPRALRGSDDIFCGTSLLYSAKKPRLAAPGGEDWIKLEPDDAGSPILAGGVMLNPNLVEVDGGLTLAEVFKAVGNNMQQIKSCFDQEPVQKYDLAEVELAWTILPDGRVADLQCAQQHLRRPEVAQCLADAVRGLRFPAPRSGKVTVRFPFFKRGW